MDQIPSDSEILRFSDHIDTEMMCMLVRHLGLRLQDWTDMTTNYPRNIATARLLILINWRDQKRGTFCDLDKALAAIEVTKHKLCTVSTGSINKV